MGSQWLEKYWQFMELDLKQTKNKGNKFLLENSLVINLYNSPEKACLIHKKIDNFMIIKVQV